MSEINTTNEDMWSIISRIQRSFAIRGVVATIRLCVARTIRYIIYFVPSKRRARAIAQFDQKWGVKTSGSFVPGKSEVVGCNWVYGTKYQGIDPVALVRVLNELPIQHEHFTFIDFGSGKGRAILVASRFPFRKIIGVEYCEQLNEIARKNLLSYSSNDRRCKLIEIVCADAARFPIPEGPLVLYFFNPFERPVMAEVTQNVAASFQLDPRRIVVIYYFAVHGDLWKGAGFIGEVQALEGFMIYDTEARETATPN